MNPIYVTTFSEAMASLVTEEVTEQQREQLLGGELDGGLELVIIRLAECAELGRYSIEKFLHSVDARSKVLGILGMNPTAQAVAYQARLRFGMEIIYHESHPIPEVERACNARLFSVDEVLGQADFICIVLPLTREAMKLISREQVGALQSQAVFLAWQRLLPIERALVHLSKNFAEPIHLDELAAVAGLSKFHFVRLFSTTLGVSPHRYQVLLRMSHAKALLRAGQRIVEVAMGVGFYDQAHFSRYFRLLVGMTPGQYQKEEAG